jgi:amino acid transporter
MPIENPLARVQRTAFGSRVHARRHTALLVAIIALLGIRPLISGSVAGTAMYSVMAMLLLVVALYTVQVDDLVGDRALLLRQRRTRGAFGWTLATVAIATRLGVLVWPSHQLFVVSSISWLLFFAFVTISELRAVLKQKTVTSETISLSISVYLLLGLTWGLFFIMLFDFQPNAFSFGSAPVPSETQVTPVLIYFSLTTLATVGYGDITPVTLQARYASVAEGIAGQFYLAILVARLVGIQMSQSSTQPAIPRPADPDEESTEEK